MQRLHHCSSAVTQHALALQPLPCLLRVAAVVVHQARAQQPAAHAHVIIVKTVGWCGVHNASAHICSHVTRVQHTVPLPSHWMHVRQTDQLCPLCRRQGGGHQPQLSCQRLNLGRQHYHAPAAHTSLFPPPRRRASTQSVLEFFVHAQRLVGGNRPRRCSPSDKGDDGTEVYAGCCESLHEGCMTCIDGREV